MPVFTLLPEHGFISDDRPARAGGPALRAGGVPAAQAQETGGLLGPIWSATRGDRVPPGYPPLPATARGLCPLYQVARAGESADLAHPPEHLPAYCSAAACALCHGRPALDR